MENHYYTEKKESSLFVCLILICLTNKTSFSRLLSIIYDYGETRSILNRGKLVYMYIAFIMYADQNVSLELLK